MMAGAQQHGLGYLAWSRRGNGDPVLDLAVDLDRNQLSSRGRRAFNGADTLAQTAEEATIHQ